MRVLSDIDTHNRYRRSSLLRTADGIFGCEVADRAVNYGWGTGPDEVKIRIDSKSLPSLISILEAARDELLEQEIHRAKQAHPAGKGRVIE